MIAPAPVPADASSISLSGKDPNTWQSAFQHILPTILSQAQYAFRHLAGEARDEAIQETVCCACVAYAQLFRRGRAEAVKPCSLAHFAILRCRGGREIAQRRNGQDALSTYARRRHVVRVQSLPTRNSQVGCWSEVLVEDPSVTPADLAASRIDYPAFLATLNPRRRQIAETLATGETTKRTAQLFGISPTRICQFRHEFRTTWEQFIGNV